MVAVDASEADVRRVDNDPRKGRRRRAGRDAAAVLADVDFDLRGTTGSTPRDFQARLGTKKTTPVVPRCVELGHSQISTF